MYFTLSTNHQGSVWIDLFFSLLKIVYTNK